MMPGTIAITGAGTNNTQEEITTIFVVGFPDDMQEREFQNMFTFSNGFEAATLKIPTVNDGDEPLGQGKKQIIGFAKFRSRVEALEAKELLSGRKVDAERGCVLKAEMAKKNLHTKRGLSNEQTALACTNPIASTSSLPVPALSTHAPSQLQSYSFTLPSTASSIPQMTAFPRRRSQLDSPMDSMFGNSNAALREFESTSALDLAHMYDTTGPRTNILREAQLLERSSSAGFPSDVYDSSSSSLSRGSSSTLLDPPLDPLSFGEKLGYPNNGPSNLGDRGFSSALFSSESIFRFGSSISMENSTSQNGSNSSNLEFYPHLGSSSSNNPSNNASPNIASSTNPTTHSSSGPTFASVSEVSHQASQQPSNLQNIPIPTITPDMDPTVPLARLGISGGDQNPPCNTLYVGNLPMDASEDELRQMFSQCAGYKRLCFKNKSNGPMCFVEFEDVQFATQALFQLYGNPLSNSTKGGIRLSYSKNPLGVRPNSQQQQNGLRDAHYFDKDQSSLMIHGH